MALALIALAVMPEPPKLMVAPVRFTPEIVMGTLEPAAPVAGVRELMMGVGGSFCAQ